MALEFLTHLSTPAMAAAPAATPNTAAPQEIAAPPADQFDIVADAPVVEAAGSGSAQLFVDAYDAFVDSSASFHSELDSLQSAIASAQSTLTASMQINCLSMVMALGVLAYLCWPKNSAPAQANANAGFGADKAPFWERSWYTSGAAIFCSKDGLDGALAKIVNLGARGIPYLAEWQRDYREHGKSNEADKIAAVLLRTIDKHFEAIKDAPLTFKILEEIYPFLSDKPGEKNTSDSDLAAKLIYRSGDAGHRFIESKIRMGEEDRVDGIRTDRRTYVSAVKAYRAERLHSGEFLTEQAAAETIQILASIAKTSNDAATCAAALDDIVAVSSRYGNFDAGFAALKDLLPRERQNDSLQSPAELRVYRLVDLLAEAMQNGRQLTDKDFESAFKTLSHLMYAAVDSRAAVNVADYALHLGEKGRAFVTEFSAGRRYYSIHGTSPGGDREMAAGLLAKDLDKLLAETAEG